MHRLIGLSMLLIATTAIAQNGMLNVSGSDVDQNRFKLNPQWQCQRDKNCNDKKQVPNATICDHNKGDPTSTTCRTEPSFDDVPTAPFKRIVCSLAPSLLHGHVNFEPVTLTGNIAWDGHSDDFDYDLVLTTLDQHLVTTFNPTTVALELDSRETVDRFRDLTGWWGDFRSIVNDRTRFREVPELFDAHADNGVAIGLLGVDCEHSCHSELHPVYAIAFRASDSTDAKEHWVYLARSFGDEGFCSHLKHPLTSDGAEHLVHLILPKPAQDVAATGVYFRTAVAPKQVELVPIKGKGVDVQIPLLATSARQVYLGEVWITGTSQLKSVQRRAPFAASKEREEPGSEQMMRRLLAGLPVKTREAIHASVLRSLPIVKHPKRLPASARKAIGVETYQWRVENRSSELHVTPTEEVDPIQEKNDLELWKRICIAYGANIPEEVREACSPDALRSDSALDRHFSAPIPTKDSTESGSLVPRW